MPKNLLASPARCVDVIGNERLADLVIVTSDNPRSEEPEQIIEEITAGALPAGASPAGHSRGAHEVRSLPDRRAAIAEAIAAGEPGDVVVIAGKGHEQGQELAHGHKLPFDDVSVASDALGERLAATAGGHG